MTSGLVAFRADASPIIGGGHVLRCLTLANALRALGARCVFVTGPETLAVVPALADGPHEVVTLEDGEPSPEALAARVGRPDWLVADHYGLGAAFEAPFRATGTRVCVLDDLASRRHDCDILLDQNLGRTAADYHAWVPGDARLLLGPRYALLRPQFAAGRLAALARRRTSALRRVLVSLGAGDTRGLIRPVMAGLAAAGLPLSVDLVLGAAATDPDPAANPGLSVTVRRDVRDMAALMAEADVAVGAGGTTSWERCCLGLPTLSIAIADNQKFIVESLNAAGAVRDVGPVDDGLTARIAAEVRRLNAHPEALASLAAAAEEICDGMGADRVARLVLSRPDWR